MVFRSDSLALTRDRLLSLGSSSSFCLTLYSPEEYQALSDIPHQEKYMLNAWFAELIIVGLAQNSLRTQRSFSVLGKYLAHYRAPSFLEMEGDVRDFGEQVLAETGDDICKIPEPSPSYPFHKRDAERIPGLHHFPEYAGLFYSGPMRLDKAVFPTHVRVGVPSVSDITDLLHEVDAATLPEDLVSPDKWHGVLSNGYSLFTIDAGVVHYCAFADPTTYVPENLAPLGHLEIDGQRIKRLAWCPRNSSPIDYGAPSDIISAK